MNNKKIVEIADRINQDPELNPGDKILVCLNRSCGSMLEDAYLLTGGGIRDIYWEASSDGSQADEAVIRMSKDGDDLVAFHESRQNTRDRRPNGIRVHHEDLDFPCVVFCNSGEERLTGDGKWLAPGEYTAVQEVDPNSPEARKFLEEYLRSPEVLAGVEAAQRDYAEKHRKERM